jgi:hypothetical protein
MESLVVCGIHSKIIITYEDSSKIKRENKRKQKKRKEEKRREEKRTQRGASEKEEKRNREEDTLQPTVGSQAPHSVEQVFGHHHIC